MLESFLQTILCTAMTGTLLLYSGDAGDTW